jgi:hypothetical protein
MLVTVGTQHLWKFRQQPMITDEDGVFLHMFNDCECLMISTSDRVRDCVVGDIVVVLSDEIWTMNGVTWLNDGELGVYDSWKWYDETTPRTALSAIVLGRCRVMKRMHAGTIDYVEDDYLYSTSVALVLTARGTVAFIS